jgi:hypothetical protein
LADIWSDVVDVDAALEKGCPDRSAVPWMEKALELPATTQSNNEDAISLIMH